MMDQKNTKLVHVMVSYRRINKHQLLQFLYKKMLKDNQQFAWKITSITISYVCFQPDPKAWHSNQTNKHKLNSHKTMKKTHQVYEIKNKDIAKANDITSNQNIKQ